MWRYPWWRQVWCGNHRVVDPGCGITSEQKKVSLHATNRGHSVTWTKKSQGSDCPTSVRKPFLLSFSHSRAEANSNIQSRRSVVANRREWRKRVVEFCLRRQSSRLNVPMVWLVRKREREKERGRLVKMIDKGVCVKKYSPLHELFRPPGLLDRVEYCPFWVRRFLGWVLLDSV